MNNIAIKVENLSKAYQLGQIGTGTISRDLERWYARIRGKEDPFLKIGESNNQNTKSDSDVVWSLKDINFEIEQGDAVGIIGKNGAGKSTLLKILSKVTAPTSGKISGKGRIASLLEVGTGFHPELSGRENIFLNGAILGMRKKEIQRKLEEIVDFAGIERYLDTPVKRYSSGMYVRLAFAVAAHLESEILIVDEVLAVGDAEFQKKCLGKMGEVSRGEGRTVLFVSHNMGAVKQLCRTGVILDQGSMLIQGNINRVIKTYVQLQQSTKQPFYKNLNENANILKINTEDVNQSGKISFEHDENIILRLNCRIDSRCIDALIGIKILDTLDRCIFTSEQQINELVSSTGITEFTVTIPNNLLTPGDYKASIAIHIPNVQIIEQIIDKIFFEVLETGTDFHLFSGADYGCVFADCRWDTINSR